MINRFRLKPFSSSRAHLLSLPPLIVLAFSAFLYFSCSDVVETVPAHPVPFDLEPVSESEGKLDGLSDHFDPEWLMSDLFFLNTSALSVDALQYFLENTPYGVRSWLADYQIDGLKSAEMIIRIAYEEGINPLLILARMQVEQGLISQSAMPDRRSLDAALGCGCHDGESCNRQYKGLPNQLRCAANTLRSLFDQSRKGEGQWRAGTSRRTLDPITVRPSNHATAAMYAYTPWVLKGRGGNWLAWNIMKKFTHHLKMKGLIGSYDEGDLSESSSRGTALYDGWSEEELSACLYRSGRAFVGEPCACQQDCDFWSGASRGFCHPAGFCSLSCEGGCPDVLNKAHTFCIEDPRAAGAGICVSKSSEINGHCADLPNTVDVERERFVGTSGADRRSSEVCAPK